MDMEGVAVCQPLQLPPEACVRACWIEPPCFVEEEEEETREVGGGAH